MKANGPMPEWLADLVQMTVLAVVGAIMVARRLRWAQGYIDRLALRIMAAALAIAAAGLVRTGFAGFWQ
jgi:hypothetical protein